MKRKVIQLAGKTFVVTLPTGWVRQWGVRKGEEIELVEKGPALVISTSKPKELRKETIDVSSATERTLRWILSSLHKKGYDEIEIRTENPLHAILIDELLKDLFLGFAVVHRSGSKCIVRSLSRELDDQFDIILRRAFLVTLSLAEQSLVLVKQKRFAEFKDLISLEKTNNQLTNFCERILNKRGHPEPVKTTFLYVIIWNLEKIADDYKYLGESLLKKPKLGVQTIKIFEEVNALFRKYYELFYKFDLVQLSSLSDDFRKIRDEIEKLLPKSDDSIVLSHLYHIALKTVDFSASTFALHD